MDAEERRREILHHLSLTGQETMENLSTMFGVSVRTIFRDIEQLSVSNRIRCVRGRHGGGVIYEGDRPRLTQKHYQLLVRLSQGLSEQDAETMQEIMEALTLRGA